MHRSNPYVALLGLTLALLTCGASALPAADEIRAPDSVSLRWALGALDENQPTPSAIQKDTQLRSGTKLKFLVEPLSAGSVYLLLLDSSEELHVLYRQTLVAEKDVEPAYIPHRGWFELEDGAGMETFFLLASVEPLRELEGLLDRYEAADAATKKVVVGRLVEEIRRLYKANRDFARPVEKPVMIGGQTRGTPEDGKAAIDRLAQEVTAEKFYGKTITIDH